MLISALLLVHCFLGTYFSVIKIACFIHIYETRLCQCHDLSHLFLQAEQAAQTADRPENRMKVIVTNSVAGYIF